MKISVKFRPGLMTQRTLTQDGVGVEVGKGVLAIFPLDNTGKNDGTATMYPLDLIEVIEVAPADEPVEGGAEPTPIRRNQH